MFCGIKVWHFECLEKFELLGCLPLAGNQLIQSNILTSCDALISVVFTVVDRVHPVVTIVVFKTEAGLVALDQPTTQVVYYLVMGKNLKGV